jgi:hypothetical protein
VVDCQAYTSLSYLGRGAPQLQAASSMHLYLDIWEKVLTLCL